MNDPFGLTSVDVGDLRRRPGIKWADPQGRLASWIADMDFPIAPAIVERLQRRVATDVGYPRWDEAIRTPLAQRFADRMAALFGWSPDVERLRGLSEVIQGIQLAIHHLTAPGDGVIVHAPAYPPFLESIAAAGRRLVPIPAVDTGTRFEWDYDELDSRLEATREDDHPPRLWVLCHPHNPTGRVFPRAELERIAELAERHDLVVASDEIHAELVHPPHGHLPFAAIDDGVAKRTVTVTSSSKAFNLAGLRWAILHAGVDELDEAIRALPAHYLGTPNLLAVEATDAAWTAGDGWLAAVRRVLDGNRTRLAKRLAEHLPGVGYHEPEATYLAWLDCRSLGLGDDPATSFRERGVELSPGPRFGPGGDGFARLNFATSPAVLDAIVAAMADGRGREL